ncbi:putative zinc ribbon domain protein [Candidatus Methanoplasma termitum]|uniref:Putative zinc ribbon domain protein n=1 Tax=Candidatus Methanoplasma termitum TaxID=1577791 RepID=A0A0A7LFW4_9ARCH|nr:zinc ribbon domain-containing protein [Candidatus Methanoplasma termitum]AIZ56396.1 putative zinc ribbon domain protein [Candidatus Methanoplasma termitum]MCL2333704.1 zinc ribbon domain-containing protein [Candidatus Methanoplasma sp.]
MDEMDDLPVCQSCGMPLEDDEMKGTNKDGSRSDDYCFYCFADGAFTRKMTLEEMIQSNIRFLDEWIRSTGIEMTEEEAIEQLREYLPTLKRWKS